MKIRRYIATFFLATSVLIAGYVTLLRYPQSLFSYTTALDNLVLRSDQPFEADAGKRLLALVEAKLMRSPLYSSAQRHTVFICNARWRQLLFFNKDYGVGGVAPYPLSDHVFLRDADINTNRLISPHGTPVAGARTLDYFATHEITHQLTGHAIGPLQYYRLPQWVREGYADYVGKGDAFNYSDTKKSLLADAPEMNWNESGLYLRFHLFVSYVLDHKHWTVERLLTDPPAEASIEAEVRFEKP